MRREGMGSLAVLISVAASGFGQGAQQYLRGGRDREAPSALRINPQSANSWGAGSGSGAYQTPTQWQLGVQVQNLEVGAQVLQVVQGSPAQRAGLERGDVIIAVNGYQVGYVNGTLFDIGDELSQRADPQGRVRMLVQNYRNAQLGNMDVQAMPVGGANYPPVGGVDPGGGFNQPPGVVGVTGNLRISGQPPRPGSMAVVRLVHYVPWTGQSSVIADNTFAYDGSLTPAFAIPVRPDELQAGRRFGIEAQIIDQGAVVYSTSKPVQITLDAPAQVQLDAIGSGGNAGPANLDAIAVWIRKHLRRSPRPQEIQQWQYQISRGTPMQEIQANLLASSEFYEHCDSDPREFVEHLYEDVRGQELSARDKDSLASRLMRQYQGNRLAFVRAFLNGSL